MKDSAFPTKHHPRGHARSVFHRWFGMVQTFFKMFADSTYHFPRRLWILAVFSLLYLVCPIDIIPDFIPVLGFADDVSLLTGVFFLFVKEVKKYERKEEVVQ